MEHVRVFVVAGTSEERTRLGALIEADNGLELVGQGSLELDAEILRHAGPDAVVAVRDRSAIRSAVAGSWSTAGDAALIALVSSPDDAAEAMAAGARGVLTPDVDAPALAAAVRAAACGLLVLAPEFGAAAAGARDREAGVLVEDLTPRELEVLQVLAEGRSNREIAQRLGISEHTVKFHVDAILGKLGAHTRTEAVARAARHGLIIL
ncbi:MAG: response regulator transcription factor [Armatimonadota bacterium]|nr:response regulator transcription factor [Armatimonadota bacterium]